MTTRYEIKAWRKSRNDKAYTVRLGSAWTDDKAANLEYVTRKGNAAHAIALIPRKKGPIKPKPPKKGLARGDRHWTAQSPERIARGSRIPHCKITEAIVQEIRRRVSKGEVQRVIAQEIGLSVAQISRIVRGKRWSHVK